ncbi:MAG: DUF2852 domain-containing protein [Halocynthiibacter sp.]
MTTATAHPTNIFRRTEAWMDERGKGAWIALMVLGFIFGGPLGLVILAYILITGRFGRCSARRDHAHGSHRYNFRSSGNTAFDAYKADTISRLENEQDAFEGFLQRLRDAKDKSEFDEFMKDHSATSEAEPKSEKEDA